MRDISELGDTWQFQVSKELLCFVHITSRPVTRLAYDENGKNLYCSSYDKSIKRFDMESRKVEQVFKLDNSFDSDVFIHHFIPYPDNPAAFLVSLGNGYLKF